TLQLNMSSSSAVAIPTDLVIGDGLNPSTADTDIVQFSVDTLFDSSKTVTINSTGLLDLNGHNTLATGIGPFVLTAGDVFLNGGTLTLASGVQTLAAATSAKIRDAVAGAGRLALTVPTTFDVTRGTGTNANGTLIADLVVT